MTLEEFKTEYKKHFGKNPRKDRLESSIKQLEEKTGQSVTIEDGEIPPGPDPGDTPPAQANDGEIPPGQDPGDEPPAAFNSGEIPPEPDPGDEPPAFAGPESQGVAHTKQWKVLFRGQWLYWTKPVINVVLKDPKRSKELSFPKDTTFQTDATINKCKNC